MTLAPDRPTTKADHVEVNSRLRLDGESKRPQWAPFKLSGRPNAGAHLTPEQIERIGRELDELRDEVMDSRGARDAAYIRRMIKTQRGLEVAGRVILLGSGVKVSGIRPAWWIGTAVLSVAKILENMEIGHNVLHGQWDWMRDPKIHSTTWEWDSVSPASQWKHAHNEIHHTYTNVVGKDNDLGYGILRVDPDQRWTPAHLAQPVYHWLNAAFFEYGIAAYDLELGSARARWQHWSPEERNAWKKRAFEVTGKIRRQVVKDYLAWPALGMVTGSSLHVASGAFVANIVRNLWANAVIMCGHFPEGIATFEKKSIDGETRGEWYIRQMLGSGNISGSKAMHTMTGNLSHQIEHHIYPDLPSNRLIEVAPKVRKIMKDNDLDYVTGPMWKQWGSFYKRVVVLSLPNKVEGESRWTTIKKSVEAGRKRKAAREAAIARMKARAAEQSAAKK